MAFTVIDLGQSGLVLANLTTNWCKKIATGSSVTMSGALLTERGNGIYVLENPNVIVDTDFRIYETAAPIRYAVGIFSPADGNIAIETGGRLTTVFDSVCLVNTTIATLTSQVLWTLTDGSSDNNAYNGMEVIIEDAVVALQKCRAIIKTYTGSTKTVELLSNPAVFTIAVGDRVKIIPPVARVYISE
jgi:hypothetical protein